MSGQQPFQIGGGQIGGIDHEISAVAQGRNHLALEPDTVRDGRSPARGWGRRVSV